MASHQKELPTRQVSSVSSASAGSRNGSLFESQEDPTTAPTVVSKRGRAMPTLVVSVPASDESEQLDTSSYCVDANGNYISGKYVVGKSGLTTQDSALLSVDDEKSNGHSASTTPLSTSPAGSVGSTSRPQMNIDDFEYLPTKLGKGNCGSVRLARHKPSGRVMAVKEISIQVHENRQQVLNEFTTLFSSDCPNIVQFFGAFYKDPQITLALEYMDAGSLHRVNKDAKCIPEPMVAIIARQIVCGLVYLHARRLIHRDIKPSNICLNKRGEVKLMDFGITKELTGSIVYAETFIGTRNYMSPERILGKSYSYASDIWSLGVVLLECLNAYPYPITQVYLDLIQSIVTEDPNIPQTLSPECRDFIRTCLNRDASKRPSARELLEHPFIKDFTDTDSMTKSLALWLADLSEIRREARAKAKADRSRRSSSSAETIARLRSLSIQQTPTNQKTPKSQKTPTKEAVNDQKTL